VNQVEPEPLAPTLLPETFRRWFAARGWSPREHQLELLAKARDDRSALLIAPTGAGKTLAGFLPTLVELSSPSPLAGEGRGGGYPQAQSVPLPLTRQPAAADLSHKGRGEKSGVVSTGRGVMRSRGLHTLYISPLKALAVDIARNLETPIAEMNLPIKVETRTGDTPVSRRQRQRRYPPDILLTTPEQLALLLSSDDAPFLFSSLKRIVLDELHALVTSKRGDLLSLGLARLWRLAPRIRAIGLSATVAEPESLARFLPPRRSSRCSIPARDCPGPATAPAMRFPKSTT
jgi:ATP-dependent Lhr-like helicase